MTGGGRAVALWCGLAVTLAAPARAGAPASDRPDEDALFGGDGAAARAGATAGAAAPPPTADPTRRDEDALFGPDSDASGDAADADDGATASADAEVIPSDPLTIGGLLYLRLQSLIYTRGSAGEQDLLMPNLLDLYLDARPDPRVRGFVSGRLSVDPTVADGETSALGEPLERASVDLDQLWLKTDIARVVYLTVGQQPVRWGSSRIWNPTDFLNVRRREPLTLFDERTGLNLLKVHVPFEALGWNAYAIVLFDGARNLRDVGGAARLEMVLGTAELALSAVVRRDTWDEGGEAREKARASLGADLSAGIGDVDVNVEVSVTDEDGRSHLVGPLDLEAGALPVERRRRGWYARASGGVTWSFKPNDEDTMTLGAEYFFNPLGTDDASQYPLILFEGLAEPFYLGRHYAALSWLVPAPGRWDDVTFILSTLGNLSDRSFLTRLDVLATLHTRLRLEGSVMVHYGEVGGELRFEQDVPEAFRATVGVDRVVLPVVELGLNLRVAI